MPGRRVSVVASPAVLGATFSLSAQQPAPSAYVLRAGQEMVMNTRAGDMIPVNSLAADALDDLDRWAREQAGVSRDLN